MQEMLEVINKVKGEINGYDEGMCFIASNNVCYDLNEKGITSYVYNTKDLVDTEYDHYFVLCKADKIYLIDLTYSQFLTSSFRYGSSPSEEIDPNILNSLLEKGYIDDGFDEYLSSFNPEYMIMFTVDDLIGGEDDEKKKGK